MRPGPGRTVLHLDGADDQHLALVAAAATAGHGIVLTAAGNLGLVDLNQTGHQVRPMPLSLMPPNGAISVEMMPSE